MSADFEKISPIQATAEELFAWHARPGAFTRLIPPWQNISLPAGEPVVRDGSQVEIRMRRGPLSVTWLAEHRNVRPGRSFEDFQVRGPFACWEHLHDFHEDDGGSRLRDSIHYRLPGGGAGAALLGGAVENDLERAFGYRHRTTAADLALHTLFRNRPRSTVAITGASGLIGDSLAALLGTGGHRVIRLVREPTSDPDSVEWDPERGVLESHRLEDLDALIHLAGENVGDSRWTRAKRDRIRTSRVAGTRNLVESLAGLAAPPRALLTASAVGIYGDRGDELLDEESPEGEGFLADVGRRWESEARSAAAWGARVVQLRFGVVVSPRGGFLAKLLPVFRSGLGGVVGSGEQYVSWISIDDAISAVLFALQRDDLEGPINVVAPRPVTNRELTRTLGRALRRPTLLPLPAFAARAALGRMADETLLSSARVEPRRLLDAGYPFRHQTLSGALEHLLGR